VSETRTFLASDELPGWFGKLPGLGDFAHRRMPEPMRERLDHWLQRGLLRLRDEHADWTERYLAGPLWFFALGSGLGGTNAWLGVLMPSVDGVGRYFPFIIAAECDVPLNELTPAQSQAAWRWWRTCAQAALEGLENDLDAARFDAALQRLFDAEDVEPDVDVDADTDERTDAARGAAMAWPAEGQSLWLTDPAAEQGLRMTASGLPTDARFDALFGFASDEWVQRVEAAR
jgi:type VI secretion system protein ImpM